MRRNSTENVISRENTCSFIRIPSLDIFYELNKNASVLVKCCVKPSIE